MSPTYIYHSAGQRTTAASSYISVTLAFHWASKAVKTPIASCHNSLQFEKRTLRDNADYWWSQKSSISSFSKAWKVNWACGNRVQENRTNVNTKAQHLPPPKCSISTDSCGIYQMSSSRQSDAPDGCAMSLCVLGLSFEWIIQHLIADKFYTAEHLWVNFNYPLMQTTCSHYASFLPMPRYA